MPAETPIAITALPADDVARRIPELGALLHACVHAGANINFVMPFPMPESEAFWRDAVLPAVRAGTRIVLVVEREGRILGSVQLGTDTPPNQAHRAEVTKLLVHPDHRRRGFARALMAELEVRARGLGRSLITLDTRTGDSAESLYTSLGYVSAGVILGFCRDPFEDRLDPTTIMYKMLGA
jgi:ribosomal protein S18 acetylase RimI-like enzyme